MIYPNSPSFSEHNDKKRSILPKQVSSTSPAIGCESLVLFEFLQNVGSHIFCPVTVMILITQNLLQ